MRCVCFPQQLLREVDPSVRQGKVPRWVASSITCVVDAFVSFVTLAEALSTGSGQAGAEMVV